MPPPPRNSSAALRLRSVLQEEFARRKRTNSRYSLRAFAYSIALDHSTVSQLMRGQRTVTQKSIRSIGTNLRWNGASVLRFSSPGFDSRVIAAQVGLSVDEVNVALTDLCMFGLLQLQGE